MSYYKPRPKIFVKFNFSLNGREREITITAHEGAPYVTLESLANLVGSDEDTIANYVQKEGYPLFLKQAPAIGRSGPRIKQILSLDAALLFLFEGTALVRNSIHIVRESKLNALYEALKSPDIYRKIYSTLNLKLSNHRHVAPKTTAGDYVCIHGACFKPIARARFEM